MTRKHSITQTQETRMKNNVIFLELDLTTLVNF